MAQGPGSRPRGRKALILAAIEAEPLLGNAAIGRLFGISGEAVRQVRVACGLPLAEARAAREAAIRAAVLAGDGASLAEIGARHGVSEDVVRQRRLEMKRGSSANG